MFKAEISAMAMDCWKASSTIDFEIAHNVWHKILYLLLIFKRVEDQILRHFKQFILKFVK